MAVEKAIYAILSDATQASSVISIVGTRKYPVIAPQAAAYPNIVFRRKQTDRTYNLTTSDGIPKAFVDVTACALTYSEARDLGTEIKECFDLLYGTYGGVEVHKIFIEDEFDGLEFQTEGREKPVFTVTITLKVIYRE